MQSINHYQSPLGGITLAGTESGLTGLWFDGQKYFGATLTEESGEEKLPVFAQTRRWLDCYFSGKEPDFLPPLLLSGTPFRLAVWEILQKIPYGEMTTYGRIAKQLAAQRGLTTMSAQAIGNAVAHNPISILVPCHRVVGSRGSLTGYAGGLDKKLHLLTLEKADIQAYLTPGKHG